MTLADIVSRLSLEVLAPELAIEGGDEVTRGHASDLLNDVLANAPSAESCSQIQVPLNVVAVALHPGLAAVVFAQGMRPEVAVRGRAVQEGLPLLASAESTFDLAGRMCALGLRGRAAREESGR